MSHLEYGSVVWVRLGQAWWPGTMTTLEKCPPEFVDGLRKTPVAVVKFFHENEFQDVNKAEHIYPYSCERKEEFIKRGQYINKNQSHGDVDLLAKFESDVVTAEKLTGGDMNILTTLSQSSGKRRVDYSDLGFGQPKVKKKKDEGSKRGTDIGQHVVYKKSGERKNSGNGKIPRVIIQHKVRILEQPIRESIENDSSASSWFKCYVCGFTCTRLNVIMWHNKAHLKKVYDFDTGIKVPGRRRRKPAAAKGNKKKGRPPKGKNNIDHSHTNGDVSDVNKEDTKQLLQDWDDEEEEAAAATAGTSGNNAANGRVSLPGGLDEDSDNGYSDNDDYPPPQPNHERRPMPKPADINSAFDALLATTPTNIVNSSSSQISNYIPNDSDSDASDWEKYYDKNSDSDVEEVEHESDIKGICEAGFEKRNGVKHDEGEDHEEHGDSNDAKPPQDCESDDIKPPQDESLDSKDVKQEAVSQGESSTSIKTEEELSSQSTLSDSAESRSTWFDEGDKKDELVKAEQAVSQKSSTADIYEYVDEFGESPQEPYEPPKKPYESLQKYRLLKDRKPYSPESGNESEETQETLKSYESEEDSKNQESQEELPDYESEEDEAASSQISRLHQPEYVSNEEADEDTNERLASGSADTSESNIYQHSKYAKGRKFFKSSHHQASSRYANEQPSSQIKDVDKADEERNTMTKNRRTLSEDWDDGEEVSDLSTSRYSDTHGAQFRGAYVSPSEREHYEPEEEQQEYGSGSPGAFETTTYSSHQEAEQHKDPSQSEEGYSLVQSSERDLEEKESRYSMQEVHGERETDALYRTVPQSRQPPLPSKDHKPSNSEEAVDESSGNIEDFMKDTESLTRSIDSLAKNIDRRSSLHEARQLTRQSFEGVYEEEVQTTEDNPQVLNLSTQDRGGHGRGMEKISQDNTDYPSKVGTSSERLYHSKSSDQSISSSGTSYMLVAVDAQGNTVPTASTSTLNENRGNLMAVEATLEDGATRTLYIDPTQLGPDVDLNNLVLHIDTSGQEHVIIPTSTSSSSSSEITGQEVCAYEAQGQCITDVSLGETQVHRISKSYPHGHSSSYEERYPSSQGDHGHS